MLQTRIRILIIEDNLFIRTAIRRLLTKSQDFEVVGEASNGREALRLLGQTEADVLLLDVEMPVMNGIELARILKDRTIPKPKILVLSSYDDQEYVREMFLNGASGYLLKDEAPERIIDAVRGIANGGNGWVSPQIEAKLNKKRRNK